MQDSIHGRTPSQHDNSPLAYQSRPPSQAGATGHDRATGRTPSPKRRRLHLNPPLHAADPSSIVVADMQNEGDALHILALASGQSSGRDGNSSLGVNQVSHSTANHDAGRPAEREASEPLLQDFPFIKLGLMDIGEVEHLSGVFFKFHHHLFVSHITVRELR